MTSKLTVRPPYEAESSLEITLRQTFYCLEPQLRPPFPLTIPTQEQYSLLNKAILYAILSEPHLRKIHIKHLHGVITDGYGYFTSILVIIVNDIYGKLVDSAKRQLLWIIREMVDVAAVGFTDLLVALLRQIVAGDSSEENLWLCYEMVTLFSSKWDCLLQEGSSGLTAALYVFLRLLSDHCRVSISNAPKFESLIKLEKDFCVKMLREKFGLCLRIGRDLVRLLQDLVHVPEFRAIWRDLLYAPSVFGVGEFLDISMLYYTKTPKWFFLLTVSPQMESQLRFLLTHVEHGSQLRYQDWFTKKFLSAPEKNAVLIDIVRFICCAHHPSNDIIHSGIIQRWAVIGWLLKSCMKNYIAANMKLALFYDWLFFNEKLDSVMDIEPALLLMVHSIPEYIDITNSLLEFLFLLLDNYDLERKEIVLRGISSSLHTLLRKGVVKSLEVLTRCDKLSQNLKERLAELLSGCSGFVDNSRILTSQML
ncbi:integrator complex subunit 3 [Salvia hispanica]|uniref:integrator complex subunit 3 n=1 Tax=Salvia hispanica TaxID=49212 RepID=UPI002009D3FA|nr:integrator complex subunit 3 [Salvia hispanica]XP_047941900.1 integrator complex subunit 3 [Salvia hispanica]XP_047941901.1 integrator complex subunit 3 [Salvia hispanica]